MDNETIERERKHFEVVALLKGYNINTFNDVIPGTPNYYISTSTNYLWAGWLARASFTHTGTVNNPH